MVSNDITKFVDGNGNEFNFRDPSKESLANKVTSIRASSSASDDKYPSEKAVASAIEALDVSSVGGSGKYISAISETDGKISATATTMDTTPTASSQKAVTSGGVKAALDDKNWFKNKGPTYLQNSNAYYQCISASTTDFSGLVKLYDVTEFFDGTIVNQNERSVFFGDVSLIRDGGMAGCKYARVCAMIGYNNSDSNIILQSDDDNAYPLLVKEDFERLTPSSEIGAYVISNGTATLDTSVTKSRYFTVDCSSYSRMFINAGFYSPSSYGLSSIKAYIFVNDSNVVLGNADGTNFDGYVDVPSGATKLYLHTNNGYSQVSVGPTTNSPRYFLAMRYVAGWPAGTIEYFGRFYTRTTDSASYSARPLLLTYVQNLAPTGTTYIPSGYVVVKSAKYVTHSAVSDKLATARKLKTNLARTADSTFDGSADQTNIPVTGTLPVGNGGTGKASVTANSYLKGNGTGALVERTYAQVRTDLGISDGANKVEASTTNGKIKIDGTDTTVYTHPTNGANTSKGDTTDQTPSFGHTFKVLSATVDSQGHTTALAEHTVTIPNTVVTGGNSGEAGLMSPSDKDKVEALGTASTKYVPTSGNASDSQVVMGNDTRLTDARTPTAHSHNTDADEVTDNTAASGLAVVTDTTEIVTTNTDGYSSNDKKLYRRPLKTKVWPWIKGLLSSESGVNISGSSASCTGNAATATSADTATTATRLGGVRVIENETDTRIKLVNVPTLGSYTWIKWQCLITVENAGGYGNKGTSITLLAKGDAQGQTRYNHKLTILSNNNWNLSRYRPMIWNVANGDGIDAMFGVWDAVDNHLETYSEIRVTVTIFPGNIQNATYQLTHDAGTWSAATTYLTTFASSSCTEIVDYGRADVPSDTDKIVRVGWNKSAVPVVTPDSSYEYSSGQTVSATAYLVAAYGYDGVGYYKDVQAGNVTVGNSQKWNGYSLVVGSASSSPAANTLYIF